MRIASGPRPWSIHAFAAILLGIASWNLANALFDLPAQQEFLASLGLGLEWNRDWTIITSSAWFTIELIPVAWVWLFASRFARKFVTVMAAIKLALLIVNLSFLYALPGILLGQAIPILAVSLLYIPDAERWFARPEERDPAIFR